MPPPPREFAKCFKNRQVETLITYKRFELLVMVTKKNMRKIEFWITLGEELWENNTQLTLEFENSILGKNQGTIYLGLLPIYNSDHDGQLNCPS